MRLFPALFCVLAALVGLAAASNFRYLIDDTFAAVKNAPREQFVVFYHSSNPDHLTNLAVRISRPICNKWRAVQQVSRFSCVLYYLVFIHVYIKCFCPI